MKHMNDKYYTPTIDEFYVGFEFEYKNNGKPWKQDKMTQDDFWNDTDIDPKRARVKYLDKEDIESLGFEKTSGLGNLTWYFELKDYNERIHPDNAYRYWHLYLRYYPDRKILKISADVSDGSEDEKFFEGIIKNKSELKRVLKMLNVSYE